MKALLILLIIAVAGCSKRHHLLFYGSENNIAAGMRPGEIAHLTTFSYDGWVCSCGVTGSFAKAYVDDGHIDGPGHSTTFNKDNWTCVCGAYYQFGQHQPEVYENSVGGGVIGNVNEPFSMRTLPVKLDKWNPLTSYMGGPLVLDWLRCNDPFYFSHGQK